MYEQEKILALEVGQDVWIKLDAKNMLSKRGSPRWRSPRRIKFVFDELCAWNQDKKFVLYVDGTNARIVREK